MEKYDVIESATYMLATIADEQHEMIKLLVG